MQPHAGLTACRTDGYAGRTRKLLLSAPASFDVMVAAVPLACCPVCERISLSVRNPGEEAVDIDWSGSRMEHNGVQVNLPLEGQVERRGGATLSTLAPGSTWTGVLRPEPGAPNASSLEEGKLRVPNGERIEVDGGPACGPEPDAGRPDTIAPTLTWLEPGPAGSVFSADRMRVSVELSGENDDVAVSAGMGSAIVYAPAAPNRGAFAMIAVTLFQRVRLAAVQWLSATLLLCAAGHATTAHASHGTWWDTSWERRIKLVVDNTGRGTLTDVPVLVKLNASRIEYVEAHASGHDLRFVDADGLTELPYDIESWNSSGDSLVWVKIPQLDSNSQTDHIWLYYGNAAVSTSGQDKTGVWDDNFRVVMHMDGVSNSASSPTPVTVTDSGTTDIAGKVGRGRWFDGIDDTISTSPSLDAWMSATASLSFWILSNANGAIDPWNTWGVAGVNGAGYDDDIYWGYFDNDEHICLNVGGTAIAACSTTSIKHATNSFHIALTRDSATGELKVYVDGSLERTTSDATGKTGGAFSRFGVGGDGTEYLTGMLDEVRSSDIVRSPDWFSFEYASQIDNVITWCSAPYEQYLDADEDGHADENTSTTITSCSEVLGYALLKDDCNDDPNADGQLQNPSLRETCGDGIDNDCDGLVDADDVDDAVPETWYADADGDGFGDLGTTTASCGAPSSGTWVKNPDDCDDLDPLQYPDALEVENGEDDDCDLTSDEGTVAYDDDGDGYCEGWDDDSNGATDPICTAGAKGPGDCDDGNGAISADAIETWYDGTDQDCDGKNDYDQDGDSYVRTGDDSEVGGSAAQSGDCDDSDAAVHPTASEVANGTDDDCDGTIDEGTVAGDDDGDGYCEGWDHDGNAGTALTCSDGTSPGDCDDAGAALNPATVWYLDGDGDSYGGAASATPQCVQPPNTQDGESYVMNDLDCDDTDASISPDTIWYYDNDNDSYGDASVTEVQCTQPPNYVRSNGDCDDNDATVMPDTAWYADTDNDGYGDIDNTIQACAQPSGYTRDATDCNDQDGAMHPSASETCGDGVDSNCDLAGGPDSDDDGDGYSWTQETAVGADDCDTDSDDDGVPDAVEWADGDHDGDGIHPSVDTDDDDDGVPTAGEDYDYDVVLMGDAPDGDPTNDDTDGNGAPDYIDADDDNDGILSADEDLDGDDDPRNDDSDADYFPDYRDYDDDGDLVPTRWENEEDDGTHATPLYLDSDSDDDLVVDGAEWGYDWTDVSFAPYDPNGVVAPRDTDQDGTPDILDSDDDDDGIDTVEEVYFSIIDGDPDNGCIATNDGKPSYLDIDTDGDGVCDGEHPTTAECTYWGDVIRGDGSSFQENFFDDKDADGVPTAADCADLDFGAGDSDGDGLIDTDETAIGTSPSSPDTDGDGLGDEEEVGDVNAPTDSDGDSLIDAVDADDDDDTVPTVVELDGATSNADAPDTNSDGTKDYLDDNDDGDGHLSRDEDWNNNDDPTDDDIDGDELADYLDADHSDGPLADADGDCIINEVEDALGTGRNDSDSDDDGVTDTEEFEADCQTPRNTDGTDAIDALDSDDDNDGISTSDEGALDVDGDGQPSFRDTDSDGDGALDADEGEESDVDGDGIPDFLDAVDDRISDGGVDAGAGPSAPGGCGCRQSPSPVELGGLGLILLGLARRRRR